MAGAESFPKDERIRRRAEYLALQGEGGVRSVRKLRSDSFLAFVAAAVPTGGEPVKTRFGITASKRVGGAVQRNRAKRLFREVLRRHKAAFPPALDLVFVVHQQASQRSYAQLAEEMKRLAARLSRRGGSA